MNTLPFHRRNPRGEDVQAQRRQLQARRVQVSWKVPLKLAPGWGATGMPAQKATGKPAEIKTSVCSPSTTSPTSWHSSSCIKSHARSCQE